MMDWMREHDIDCVIFGTVAALSLIMFELLLTGFLNYLTF